MKLLITLIIVASVWAGAGYVILNSDKTGSLTGMLSDLSSRSIASTGESSAKYSLSGEGELRELHPEDGSSFSKTAFKDYSKRSSPKPESVEERKSSAIKSGPVARHNPQMRIDPGIRVERNAAKRNSCP